MDWRDLIGPALAHGGGTHSLEDVAEMLTAGEAQLWLGANSALITTIDQHPRFDAINLWLAGGDMGELVNDLRPAAERWAKEHHNCTKATLVGRKGWANALRPHGYQTIATLVMKDIS